MADCGSFSQAAEKLYLSSTAVMKQLNALERHLELKLPQSATQTKVANWGLNMAAPPFRSNFWLIPWYKIGASLSSQPGLK